MRIKAHNGDPALIDVLGEGMTFEQMSAWIEEQERIMTTHRLHRVVRKRLGVKARRWVNAAEARRLADEADAASPEAEVERRVQQRLIDERLRLIHQRVGVTS